MANKITRKRTLTVKQKAFADFYIETGNAAESARRAGYSPRTARGIGAENLTKPYIQDYIEKRLKELEDARIADATEVMQYLTAVMRGEEIEEIVGFTEAGPETVEKLPYVKDRVKAAELLGKRYSLFTDRMDLDASVGVRIIDDIEDDEDED